MSNTKTFSRKWTKSTSSTPFVFYDLGETQWLIQKDGSVKTYKILSRKVESQEPFIMLEEVLLLPETPVPLEAQQQEVRGWEISESPVKQEALLPSPSVVASPPLASQSQRQTSQYNKKQQVQPSQGQTHREQHSPASSVSGEEQLAQQTVTLPTELWLSLSQWIPPNALFQPSLHHQAILELCDTPGQISVDRSTQGTYSRPQQGKHQFGARGMPPRQGHYPYPSGHRVSEVFSHKPRVHQQDFLMNSAKPLFI